MTSPVKTHIRIERETTLYGEDVVEKWDAVIKPASENDRTVTWSVDVRPGGGKGSKPVHKQDDVPILDVPDEVVESAREFADKTVSSLSSQSDYQDYRGSTVA